MPVPYAFANASGVVPASQLDANFQYLLGLMNAPPTLPYTFATAGGFVPASELDANFTYLLNLIGQGATPSISYTPPALTGPLASGTAAGTATITGLSGGSWSLSPTTDFTVNASTGAVTADTTVPAGTYPFTLTYTGTAGGQTVTVSLATSIVVSSSGAGSPSLDFSQSANSQYVPALAA